MAKFDDNVVNQPFAWRLWLYAAAVTAAAVAGGYFSYEYRAKANTCSDKIKDCDANTAALGSCKTDLGAANSKAQELSTKLAEGSKNLTATAAELAQLRAQKAEADKRMAAIDEIQKQFAKMIDTGQLRVVARHGQLVLSLPSEVLFPTGSANLSKVGEYAVVEVGAVLKRFPDRRFLIVGHTDNQDFVKPKGVAASPASPPSPTDSAEIPSCIAVDNWQLSTERALTVVRVLTTAGMKAENLIPAGEGEHDPVASNSAADGRQRNRRIEIALLPAINELPPLPASLKEDTGGPMLKK
jgi:chemotaxis protein MotB